MKIFFVTGLFLLLLANFSFSHEHWIDLENFNPAPGEKVKILVCSGHNFPKSTAVLDERVFRGITVIEPDGASKSYQTRVEENLKTRSVEFTFAKKGVYMIAFYLVRPPMEKPVYYARALVFTKGERELKYLPSQGLEIVPQANLAQLKVGQKLSLEILNDGKPIKGTISVSVEGGKSYFIQSDKRGRAIIKIKKAGKYLLTTSYKGIGCSLTFSIEEAK